MIQLHRILASTVIGLAACACVSSSAELPPAHRSGLNVAALQDADHEYELAIEKFMRDYVDAVLRIREKQYAAGDYSTSRKERELTKSFDDQVKNYIAGIGQLATLEALCNHLWSTDVPDDMPVGIWTDAEESIKWFLCERIAQYGTREAYESLSRLRKAYADGAWGGFFRSLEWKYLRQYSTDPAVLKSKSGKFH